MSIPPQSVVPGQLADEHERQQQLFIDQGIVGRLWAKDASLWPAGGFNQDKIACNLCWIDLPDSFEPLVQTVKKSGIHLFAEGKTRLELSTLGCLYLGFLR